MAPPNPVVSLIIQGARARGIDPSAALAVASQEGLSGGIGDGGHAYGPFQLNNAGGVISGMYGGRVNDRSVQQWATSPAGINWALDRIAPVARGKQGRAAVEAIVRQFERPANPDREVLGAWGAYGRYGTAGAGGASGPQMPPPVASPSIPARSRGVAPGLLALLNQGNSMFGLPALSAGLASAPLRLPAAGPSPLPRAATAPPDSSSPPLRKGSSLGWLEHQAAPFGLTITSTTGGQHAAHSYHYQGRAVDLGGSPAKMAAAANYALQHPSQFTEMFYTGPGHPNYFISGGKVLPLSQLDSGLYREHENHVHWAR